MEAALLKDLFEEENTHWWHVAKRKLICGFLPGTRGSVLVLGVGGGRLCDELARTFQVTAIDISPEACQHVKEAYGINAIKHDLEAGLPFDDEIFDVVIIADVLEHIRDDNKLLKEIHRCLKRGGTLLLTVPAYAHMWSYWDEQLHHCRRYEYKALKGLIRSQDFQIRKMSFFNALIYPAAFIRRKFVGSPKNGSSDFKISQGGFFINTLMRFYYATERAWMRIAVLPFGLSIFVCARKT